MIDWKGRYEDLMVDFQELLKNFYKCADNFNQCKANFDECEKNFNQVNANFKKAIEQRDENKRIIDSLREEIRLLKQK